jgi:hypothetical protein
MTKYTLYVPKEALSVAVEKQVRVLVALFGGVTRTAGQGEWINEAGMPIVESTYIYTFLSPRPWHDLQYQVRVVERSISRMTGEACVLSTNEQSHMTMTLQLKRG